MNAESSMSESAEAQRLEDLRSYEILDTEPEPQFDSIVALARVLFDTPMASITLVDADRQWFKAKSGLLDQQTAREHSFCTHTIGNDNVFVVADARADPRFASNPLVLGEPNIRFYAGAPLRSAAGYKLGSMCVISTDPRHDFSNGDRKKLEILASIAGNEMELKKQAQAAHKMLYEKDFAAREAHYRLKNSLDYADLLAEVQDDNLTTEQLSAFAMAAWKQYAEAGGVLMSSIKSLRQRMTPTEYKTLLEQMPGFAF